MKEWTFLGEEAEQGLQEVEEGERQLGGGGAGTGLKGWVSKGGGTLGGKDSELFPHQGLRLGVRLILRGKGGGEREGEREKGCLLSSSNQGFLSCLES